jgi:phage tail sheath protein FI
VDVQLAGGTDGVRPRAADYAGQTTGENQSSGLKSFETVKDISIVAAPGCTADFAKNSEDALATIENLISHAEQLRYRFAILDSGDRQSMPDVQSLRSKLNSSYAALYYPWVRILDPVSATPIDLPPSGFVAGIFVRKDLKGAINQAPANEVVVLATGFEQTLTDAQQAVLNPAGINCFRSFPGRGNLLWGARTISSDPDWKYVNVRRYLTYLEQSIDEGTQWVVFEPNNETLWTNVRRTITDFLYNEWISGRLMGTRQEQAFFVKCDSTTMTQDDINNGRLVCVIGSAVIKPAEFVIFRIGQWTADRKT